MKEYVISIKKDIFNKENCVLLFFTFFFALILYFVFIANNITNQYDSLWVGKSFVALYNELECGRWLWVVIDIFDQGFKAEPVVTALSLFIFSISNVFIIETICIKKKTVKYFLSFTILTTTSVCCMLSFKHQSYIFALSYLFSSIAAWHTIKNHNKIISILFTSILLTLSLASYQSSIGCYCLINIAYILLALKKSNFEYKNVNEIIIKVIASIVLGSILYKISWDVFLNIYNTSITSYKNANTLSIANMILNLPKSICKTYIYFFEYFSGRFVINSYPAVINIMFILIIAFFVKDFFKMDFYNSLISLLMFILIPIACNFSVLYIDADVVIQQTLPTSMYIPTLLSIIFESNDFNCPMIEKTFTCLLVIISSTYFIGNVLATEKDIESMREGSISTNSIVNSVCLRLINEGYFNKYDKFYFVGKPCDSSLFNVSDIWRGGVNEYAKFGDFAEDAYCLPNSYQGVINDLGYYIQCSFPSNQKFNELIENEIVINMPSYPDNNSIVVIDGYVVIKVANY